MYIRTGQLFALSLGSGGYAAFGIESFAMRYNLPRYRMAIVVNGTNLTDHPVWLPSGIMGADTVPVLQGRVVFAGIEFSTGGN
jgi:hypothetical protein